MIRSETSYAACRNILDMKEGNACHHHLKSRAGRGIEKRFMGAEPYRVRDLRCFRVRHQGISEVSQRAHMKSFSWFYRRMYVVLASLQEHRCSRITLTGGESMFI